MNLRIKKNRIILKTSGHMPLPQKLVFEPTLQCNLHCSMCERFEVPNKQNKDLTLTEIKKVMENLPSTIKEVYISGGEPFMRKDLVDICNLFLQKGIKVMVQTNGTNVKEAIRLSRLAGVQVIFSLDGPKEIHNRIRGMPFVYEKNIEILRSFKRMKKHITITSVITDKNIDYLSDLAQILNSEKLKPDFLIIELARRFTREIVEKSAGIVGLSERDFPLRLKERILPDYSLEEFRKKIKELDAKLRKYGFKYSYYPRNLLGNAQDFYLRAYRENNEVYCSHLEELRIDPKGNVIPCFIIRKSFGNAFKSPTDAIWNSKEFCDYRVNLVKNNLLPVCETCYCAQNKQVVQDEKKRKVSLFLSSIKNRFGFS